MHVESYNIVIQCSGEIEYCDLKLHSFLNSAQKVYNSFHLLTACLVIVLCDIVCAQGVQQFCVIGSDLWNVLHSWKINLLC